MMRAAALLLLCAVLTGCGDPAPTTNEATSSAPKLSGWSDAFGMPANAVTHANQFGYRVEGYVRDGDSWLAQGQPIMLSQSDTKSPNRSMFEAAGATEQAIDRFAFTLSITDPANAAIAKTRFVDILKGFLFQYQLDAKDGFDPVLKEQSFVGPIAGVPAAIDISRGDADQRTITVTFTRPTGTTPENPDQGQADGNRA